MEKRWSISLVCIVLLLSAMPSVFSLGLAIPYFENDTIRLQPGQTYVLDVNVQNNEDIGFPISFVFSSEDDIARLRPRENYISKKNYTNIFTFDISIPKNAIPGKTYPLTITITPLLNITGQTPMTVSIKRTLYLAIVDKDGIGSVPKDNTIYFIIIAITIAGILIIIARKFYLTYSHLFRERP